MIDQPLIDVLTLGKELFMFFGTNVCLRVHFLMDGSLNINKEDTNRESLFLTKKTTSPVLEIQFSNDRLTLYKCSVEMRPASASRIKYANLSELDICSSTFNQKRAVQEVMSCGERQLCDVLLDQDILPGVGNIIKNEALFDSGLKPDSKVKELTEKHITHLVKMTRDFSMVFYRCHKRNMRLQSFLKVYKKSMCVECGTKITITRMGQDSQRMTFFCPACQTNDFKMFHKLKLPARNSLLDWVQRAETADSEDWTCSKCTLINQSNKRNCAACMGSRNNQSELSFKSSSLTSEACWSPRETKENYRHANDSKVNNSTSWKLKRKSEDTLNTGCRKMMKLGEEMTLQSDTASQSVKIDNTMWVRQSDTLANLNCRNKIPVCTGHRKPCAMRQTFKENENKGRLFFVCSFTSADKKCNFFKWADEDFPICTGHSKVCALRIVMKQGPNNGRKFFCCPMRTSCNFFQWADEHH